MSDFARSFDRRLTWAVLASLALHLCFAAVFPPGTTAQSRPVVLSLVHVARIGVVRRTPTPPPPPRIAKAVRVFAVRAPRRSTPLALRRPRTAVRVARPLAVAAPQVAAAMPSAAPTTVPSAIAPLPARARSAGGYMPFGAREDDPVLDPRVLQTLRLLGVHTTLTVLVGEDGKTKSVTFSPPLDPQIENEIEGALADANWDPAYCGGGIPCAKSTIIKI